MRVLDLGGEAAQGAGHRAFVGRVPGVQPGAQVALLGTPERATVLPSPAFFWISASVCSTESCRWAATSARSWVRTRSARSARQVGREPVDPRTHDDQVRSPPAAPPRRRPGPRRSSRRGTRTSRAGRRPARGRRQAGRDTSTHHLPRTTRTGSIRPVMSSQRSAAPRPAARAEQRRSRRGRWARRRCPGPSTASTSRMPPNARAASAIAGTDVAESTDPAGPASAPRRAQTGGVGVEQRVRRKHQPQTEVERHSEPAEQGGQNEAHPHPQHRDCQVARGDPTPRRR